MPWFFILFLLSSRFYNESEARHVKELPSSVVVGTVYCDTCFQQDFSKSSHFISGASVAVECNDGSLGPNFHQEVKTNEHGEFRVHLPYSIGKHVSKIKTCSVKLLRSSEPYCSVASKAISSSLYLKSRKEGTHIFSAGFFSFKPQKQPILCNQKPSIQNSVPFHAKKTSLPNLPENPSFPPPLKDPTTPEFPTLPDLPLTPLPQLPRLPQLPPLPSLPGLPSMPSFPGTPLQTKPTNGEPPRTKKLSNNDDKEVKPQTFFPTPPLFPPNPFQPPPLIPNPFQPPPLIPNPFQPPPLFPPLLPPNPLQPPPSPLIPFLPIPGLTPPPPPPSLPFLPLPPLPKFPPSPGIPPASSTPQKSSP